NAPGHKVGGALDSLSGINYWTGPITLGTGATDAAIGVEPPAEAQQFSVNGGTGFTVTYGADSANLSAGATAAQLQAALNNLQSIKDINGLVSVSVSISGSTFTYTVSFGRGFIGTNATLLQVDQGTPVSVAALQSFPTSAAYFTNDYSLTVGTAEIQTFTINGAVGSFNVTFGGSSTGPLAVGTSAADLQTAMNNL